MEAGSLHVNCLFGKGKNVFSIFCRKFLKPIPVGSPHTLATRIIDFRNFREKGGKYIL